MKKNAFTLIEVLLAILLVGLAVVSIVGATSTLTKTNSAGINLSTAEFLTEQCPEDAYYILSIFDNGQVYLEATQ